jgi:D-glycero-beta-D-manno-heptose-7-phosphate kinase
LKILVVGESCTDVYHYGKANRMCPEAPVPVFVPGNKIIKNGGMAYNVYKNILSLDSEIDVDILTNNNWRSITKTRYVDYRTNYIVLRLDENDDDYGVCDVREIDYDKYDAIVISDYNKSFLSETNIEYISSMHDVTFLDTKKVLGDWSKGIKFIKINDVEYEKTKHSLTKDIENNIVTTMGPKGCKYRGKTYPVSKVEIKDTGGAGDTFIAALSSMYIKTRDIDKAIMFANECATKVVQKKGIVTV